mmetsp:Transcript_49624/g.73795  ORF Transcript_49624/g.73795 Transcript_49624/m.73795 type:complete len:112 (+) Transcript_49624:154-489(+)
MKMKMKLSSTKALVFVFNAFELTQTSLAGKLTKEAHDDVDERDRIIQVNYHNRKHREPTKVKENNHDNLLKTDESMAPGTQKTRAIKAQKLLRAIARRNYVERVKHTTNGD